jgi:hypothetical protein
MASHFLSSMPQKEDYRDHDLLVNQMRLKKKTVSSMWALHGRKTASSYRYTMKGTGVA